MNPLVSVVANRYARSWPTHDEGEPAAVMPLSEALDLDFVTDAHVMAYVTPNERRLSTSAIEQGVFPVMTCAIFDCDCPDAHGTPEPAPESWRRGLRDKVQNLAAVYSGLYYYETKRGARVVYALPAQFVIKSPEDAQSWKQQYATAAAHLLHCFEIEADLACSDWQRLYRLPYATRGDNTTPENWPTWGDRNNIGALSIDATHADVARAKRGTKAFRERPLNLGSTANGDGLLYWLLRNRGDVGGECARSGWICLCPNRAQHTNQTDGTDATVVFPPGAGEEVGAINCLHAHCAGLGTKEWIRFFSDPELRAARAAAGIVRTA